MENNENNNMYVGIIAGIGTLLIGVIGACAKLHLQSSKCGKNGCCCDIVFDDEELTTLERHRTERRRQTEFNIQNNILDESNNENLKNNNNDEIIQIEENSIYSKLNKSNILNI